MEKINGVIIKGKVYEVVECIEESPCDFCDLQKECFLGDYNVEILCSSIIGYDTTFRYSQELTDKINEI